MSAGAGVTKGFPRIGVYLTASRHPPPCFPASGREPWEGAIARKEDNQNQPGLVGWKRRKKNKLDAMWERQRQLGPAIQASGSLSGNRPAVHPATTLSAYIMSQVQYSCGRLFKEHKSERDKLSSWSTAWKLWLKLYWSQTDPAHGFG